MNMRSVTQLGADMASNAWAALFATLFALLLTDAKARADELIASAHSNTASIADATASEGGSLLTVATTAAVGAPLRTGGMVMADKLVVLKSQRRLLLMRRGEVLRSYHVALGLRPLGHKEREGDFKTPEGEYRLIRRNPRSDFFLSMEVSYPRPEDVQRAQRSGVRPGGAIMLHGLPNTPRKSADYYKSTDWTDGCIAVANSDMVEIWLMTPLDTPIDILP